MIFLTQNKTEIVESNHVKIFKYPYEEQVAIVAMSRIGNIKLGTYGIEDGKEVFKRITRAFEIDRNFYPMPEKGGND